MLARNSELERVVEDACRVVLGKQDVVRLALACMLARGHLLIEDLPGVGKTTLAHVLARLLGLHYQRIQFTSDLLPADIIGVAVFNRDEGTFQFHPGPVFSQLVLADEINRATPKTQSALLEAMEEQQVTAEGETRPLPTPFFVIATQNPSHQVGTFPLPESQLDRFLMRLELGYPDSRAERMLLGGRDPRDVLAELPPSLSAERLVALQRRVPEVHVSDALLDYLQALLAFSREWPRLRQGLSPRAGLGILRSAQAWALLHDRDAVIPEDLQAVCIACVSHRLFSDTETGQAAGLQLARELLATVEIP